MCQLTSQMLAQWQQFDEDSGVSTNKLNRTDNETPQQKAPRYVARKLQRIHFLHGSSAHYHRVSFD